MKIQNIIKSITFCLILLGGLSASAQQVIVDSVKTKTIIKSNKKQKIDGIVATVGDYMVLDSDIDKAFIELDAQQISTKDITRCQILGKLLEDKLYAHQAQQDSIVVKDEEINETLNQKIDYMLEQTNGDIDKIVKYYKKSSEDELRSELFEILKQQKLAGEMTQKIIGDIQVTPEETRTFFKGIPEKELPVFGSELEIAQIVVNPTVTDAEKQVVVDRLKLIKKEVEEGASFKTRAVIYSDDRASASNGGFYKINKKTQFVKEFKDVAFSLQEGEISEPFETEFGYHIIYLEKIKGQDLELRHILMMPKVSSQSLKDAYDKAVTIKKRIEAKEITFAEAARTLSDEKETRANGGTLINPSTQDTRFELTKMDPNLYNDISNIKDNEISNPILQDDPRKGKSYKLIMITNRIEDHVADYSKDYTKIRELALKQKQINAIAKWSAEKIKETYIKISNDYKDCDFTNNWIKK